VNRLIRTTLILAFSLAAVLAFAQTDENDPVVIRLGDKTVTRSELDVRFEIAIRSIAAQQGIPLTAEMRPFFEDFRVQFLDQRATELVLLAEAERRGFESDEEAIDAELERIRAGFESDEDFAEVLEEAGFGTEERLRELIRESRLMQQVVDALQDEVAVSDEDVAAWYQENEAQLARGEQVCARHILVEDEETALALKEELDEGADFAELAQEHSTDPGSGPRGGDLGCFGRGQMVAPFEETAFGAEEGEVAGPVESQFGHHLILVYERQEATTIPLEEIEGEIRQQLAQEQLGAKIDELRESSGVEIYPENLVDAEPEMVEPEAVDEDAEDSNETYDHEEHEDHDEEEEDDNDNG
jgi:peptidyl-prolyl cis-trans isomerase C